MNVKKKKEKNITTNKEEYFISVSSIHHIVPNFYSLNNINSKLYRTELHGKIHKLIFIIGDLINLYNSGSVSEPIQPTEIGKNIKKHEKQIAFNVHKYFTTPQKCKYAPDAFQAPWELFLKLTIE